MAGEFTQTIVNQVKKMHLEIEAEEPLFIGIEENFSNKHGDIIAFKVTAVIEGEGGEDSQRTVKEFPLGSKYGLTKEDVLEHISDTYYGMGPLDNMYTISIVRKPSIL